MQNTRTSRPRGSTAARTVGPGIENPRAAGDRVLLDARTFFDCDLLLANIENVQRNTEKKKSAPFCFYSIWQIGTVLVVSYTSTVLVQYYPYGTGTSKGLTYIRYRYSTISI